MTEMGFEYIICQSLLNWALSRDYFGSHFSRLDFRRSLLSGLHPSQQKLVQVAAINSITDLRVFIFIHICEVAIVERQLMYCFVVFQQVRT